MLRLHPTQMLKITKNTFLSEAKQLQEMYDIDNLIAECDTWYDLWMNRQTIYQSTACEGQGDAWSNMDLIKVLDHTNFFPGIRHAINIALALPATTCTIERSFSTLRRVKTWLRSTMSDDRLSGPYMPSVHRELIADDKKGFVESVINKFAENPRRIRLFKD